MRPRSAPWLSAAAVHRTALLCLALAGCTPVPAQPPAADAPPSGASVRPPSSAAAARPTAAAWQPPAEQPASPEQDGYAVYRQSLAEAVAAYERKDYAALALHSKRAADAAPNSPTAVYNLACAHALLGKADDAVASLQRLADLGAYFDVTADPDLASIQALPGLQAVRARLEALKRPVGKSVKAFTLRERDLIPEGIAHDPRSGAFFVSSVHRRKIVRIAPGGASRDFVTEGQHGLFAVLALAVDSARRALWACSTAVPEMSGYRAEDKGRSGVFKLDVATGELRQKIVLEEPGVPHNLNDLVIDDAGNLFVADTASSAIYTLPAGGEHLEIFVAPGKLASPQGLALSPDGKTLFIADYARGIARVDRASRAVAFMAPPHDTVLAGIDGLRTYNGDLLAIQNGIAPHRVVRLVLSQDGTALQRATVLEMNNALFIEPTLGVVVQRDFFYVANSQWGSFDKGGILWPAERLKDPVILRLPLD